MSDLASGQYPASMEEWALDGSPLPPYRRTISRRDIASGSTGITLGGTTTINVYAVPVQVGDIFSFVSLLVKAAPTGTIAHSWVALYSGVATGAALLAQSADVTTGFTANALKLQLASVVSNIGTEGIPQGPSTPAIVASGPAVWGLALYSPGATTSAVLDGMPGGGVAAVALTGQPPLASTGTITAGATAPSVLPTMAAAAAGVPYAILSRQ